MRSLQPAAVLELLKPITWFAPMWAFGCGVVSSGLFAPAHWKVVLAGVALAGPLICATSQAVNDWYDRDVDSINNSNRPIPSGRIHGRWGLYIVCIWTVASLIWAVFLGQWVLYAAIVGLALAWAYSAPPLRLKQNGWWGNSAVTLAYEGLPWFTGAAVVAAGLPDPRIIKLAPLDRLGAHGIVTLNDFKSIEGDRRLGVRSLPVQLGVRPAVQLACDVMAAPQVVVIGLLLAWGRPIFAAVMAALLIGQLALMPRLIQSPRKWAAPYNATGTTLYVFGMLSSALALR
jgi:chlorophyll/bacteriochlorophyll a synthase